MRMLLLLGFLACGSSLSAAGPVLDYSYPAGGMPGSEFEIEVGGAPLAEVAHAVFSGTGVKATLIGPAKTVVYSKKGKPIVALAPNRFRFQVVIEKGAEPGVRALRVGTAYRLSEPVGFEVSAMRALSEAITNRLARNEVDVPALPACLNGRVHGAEGDRYRFSAAKGTTVIAFTESQVLPQGAFHPVLAFTDAAGKPCEGVTAYNAATAPVLAFEVPQDGAYALDVKAPTNTVGDAAVYRVKLGNLPLITGFSPPGAKEGESLNVRPAGYNLTQKRIRLFTGGKNSALCLETLTKDSLALPGLRFELSADPDAPEQEPGGAAGAAQAIEVPSVVNGVLDRAGGRDLYRFTAATGRVVYVDVHAAALGSPLRPVVTVRNARGATVAQGVFNTNANARAAIQSRDPSVAVPVTEAGPYEVEVADAQGRFGEAFAYRMRVGPPDPDFLVWMSPSSLNIPADGSALVTIYLQRLHGFNGEVRVAIDYPPLSIACEGGIIPAGESMCLMTVSTDGVRFPRTVFGLSLTASADVGGRLVKRAAIPVRFSGAGSALEARLFSELSAKANAGLRALRLDVVGKTPVEIPSSGSVPLLVLSPNLATYLGTTYEPTVVWPARGFTVQGVQRTNKQERATIFLSADPKVMRPGATGQLILGCVQKGDPEKGVLAVTQSVPYRIK